MLKPLLEKFIKTRSEAELLEYLTSNSNLPGPRGNLELAASFANSLAEYDDTAVVNLWELCRKMIAVSADEAPVNSPTEFIPFCGTVGIGAIAATHSRYFENALSQLRELARDSRWRMREAVAIALQKLITSNAEVVLKNMKAWIASSHLLELRAVAAAMAEPAILKNEKVARSALQLNQQIIEKLVEAEDRKSESFRVLRKALGYTLSVVIVPLPEDGFAFLKWLVKKNDPDINWIVSENLKKNRLIKNFSREVNSLKKMLN